MAVRWRQLKELLRNGHGGAAGVFPYLFSVRMGLLGILHIAWAANLEIWGFTGLMHCFFEKHTETNGCSSFLFGLRVPPCLGLPRRLAAGAQMTFGSATTRDAPDDGLMMGAPTGWGNGRDMVWEGREQRNSCLIIIPGLPFHSLGTRVRSTIDELAGSV